MDDFIKEQLQILWDNYTEYTDLAMNNGYPIDACYGTRVYFGSLIKYSSIIDHAVGYNTRCLLFTKYFEQISHID